MVKLKLLALVPLVALGLFASTSFTSATAARQTASRVRAPQVDQVPPNRAVAIGNVIDAIIQTGNVTALTNILTGALTNNTLRLLDLNDVLNGAEIRVLSDILESSQVLSQNVVTVQNFLNGVLNGSLNNVLQNALQNFANNNGLIVHDVVALSVLNGTPVIIVL